jgi:RNA polymerase sigma factor for flagellar operon FliA
MTPDQITATLCEHAPMVRKAARDLMCRLPACVEIDDLIQVGMIALWQSCYHFNNEHGASMAAFASHRVRGAMLDELRASDTMSKHQRRKARELGVAALTLGHALGREPALGELARATGLSLDECSQRQMTHTTCGIDDLRDAPDLTAPHAQHEQACMHADVSKAIERLPERERIVVEQHIDQDRTFAVIAGDVGISEARACQIYQSAIKRLQSKLWAWRDSHAPQVQG